MFRDLLPDILSKEVNGKELLLVSFVVFKLCVSDSFILILSTTSVWTLVSSAAAFCKFSIVLHSCFILVIDVNCVFLVSLLDR